MTKQKLTKKDRQEREQALLAAITAGLIATTEAKAKEWAYKAKGLRAGLTPAAIKRAERKAHRLAEEHPPGFVMAMEAMDVMERIFERRGVTKREQDALWGSIAKMCMHQLGAHWGAFFEAAVYFGLVPPREPRRNHGRIEVVEVSKPTARKPNCNCPNCRPRTPEELN